MKIYHSPITPKQNPHKFKQVVTSKVAFSKNEEDIFCKAIQPWGCMPFLEEAKDYKVRKIFVKPHQKLSLQYHNHRNENWIVARGNPTFQCGDSVKTLQTAELKARDSVFIPVKKLHRLENNTDSEVIIIEVQTGDYIGDDDITRIQDKYKRET